MRVGVGGGIAGLLVLIADHEEAVEADLRRFYGVRLSDVWVGGESLRHVRSLIRCLPPESALAAELPESSARPDRRPRWGHVEYLLADVVDVLLAANWQRGGGKSQRPKPYPRPGQAKKPMSAEQARRLMSRRPGGDRVVR